MEIEYKTYRCKRVLEKAKMPPSYQCRFFISPYVGCEYGCVYCHKYKDKKTSKDFSENIQIKVNAPSILKRELKHVEKGVVCISGYQPLEKEHRIIRKMLGLLSARKFPFHIITKSDAVLDDLDLLSRIAESGWCAVSFSISSLDENISSIFEPNAPSPKKRMEALGKFAEKGIVTGLALSPVIPYITDSDAQLEEVIRNAAEMKAEYVLITPLALENNCRTRVIEAVKRHYPELLLKYKSLYEFGSTPEMKYPRKLSKKTNSLLNKYGISNLMSHYPSKQMKKQVTIKDFLPHEQNSSPK